MDCSDCHRLYAAVAKALAEAHLQALEEQQNEMLFRLYLVSALQTEDLASYNDEDDYGQEQENVK